MGKVKEDANGLIHPTFDPQEKEQNMHSATKKAIEAVKSELQRLTKTYQELMTTCQQKRDLFIVSVRFHMTIRKVHVCVFCVLIALWCLEGGVRIVMSCLVHAGGDADSIITDHHHLPSPPLPSPHTGTVPTVEPGSAGVPSRPANGGTHPPGKRLCHDDINTRELDDDVIMIIASCSYMYNHAMVLKCAGSV